MLERVFYTLGEVAERIGFSKSMVEMYAYGRRRKRKDGTLTPEIPKHLRLGFIKVGRLTKVHFKELERWERTLAGTPTALDCFPLLNTKIQIVENRRATGSE